MHGNGSVLARAHQLAMMQLLLMKDLQLNVPHYANLLPMPTFWSSVEHQQVVQPCVCLYAAPEFRLGSAPRAFERCHVRKQQADQPPIDKACNCVLRITGSKRRRSLRPSCWARGSVTTMH
jgi:hypothetical protein